MTSGALRALALVMALVVAVVVLGLSGHAGWAILVGLGGALVAVPALAVAGNRRT